MVTLTLTLSEQMFLFAESEAAARGLGGAGDFVTSLLTDALRAADGTAFEARFNAALRALERGEPNPLGPEDWHRLMQRRLGGTAPAAGS